MKKILFIGSTGLLGKGFIETRAPDYEIIGVHRREHTSQWYCSHPHLPLEEYTMDTCNKPAIQELFYKYKFDAVIHAGGQSNVDYVQNNFAECFEDNLGGTINIASLCGKFGVYLIYVSSNAVFDGEFSPYYESDVVSPVNKYGEIKELCESIVKKTQTDYCIARLILMYGWNNSLNRQNPVTRLIEKLGKGETANMVNDVHENPLYNIEAGKALWEIVKRKPQGIIHIAGSETVNRFLFALMTARVFGLNVSLIKEVDSSFFPDLAPRPENTSFDTQRMEKLLGIKPINVIEGLTDMAKMRIEC